MLLNLKTEEVYQPDGSLTFIHLCLGIMIYWQLKLETSGANIPH